MEEDREQDAMVVVMVVRYARILALKTSRFPPVSRPIRIQRLPIKRRRRDGRANRGKIAGQFQCDKLIALVKSPPRMLR